MSMLSTRWIINAEYVHCATITKINVSFTVTALGSLFGTHEHPTVPAFIALNTPLNYHSLYGSGFEE
jgi:hypothetical protein